MKLFHLITLLIFNIFLTSSFSQNTKINDTIPKQDSTRNNDKFENGPLMLFDDIIIKSAKELNSIDPNTIQELTVYKNELDPYIKNYGEKAKNGIVFIYSKDYIANKWLKDFAQHNKKLKKYIEKNKIKYTDFDIYLNNELLKKDFFNKLEEKLDNQTIKELKFKKPNKPLNALIIIST